MSEYVELLQQMIALPSFSREEGATADLLRRFLAGKRCRVERVFNNLIVRSEAWVDGRPVLLLNSHHDTVRPSKSYTRDPFAPTIEDGRLYGLGSNDAGASVVSLIAAFLRFRDVDLPFNLMLVLSAEEEVSGADGIAAVLPHVGPIDMGIVGEPTGMQAAVGERGLVVLDCVARGKSGHAARDEGVNAIYIAIDDIDRLRGFNPEPVSALLGPVKCTVTQIEAGRQHNVVPDECRFVVDLRTTDAITNEELVARIDRMLASDVKARSTRLRASAIDSAHPLVAAAKELGINTFVSPTMSDMALMPFPTIKIGPGDSARSHTADEYIFIREIDDAIEMYTRYINTLKNHI